MFRSEFIPSEYQSAIFDFVVNGTGNGIIEAVAGSGKTTTLVKCLDLIPEDKKVLFCAFNKHIVEELKKRVPKKVRVSTLNSLGHQAWMARHNYKGIQLDDDKVRKITKEVFENYKIFNQLYGQVAKKTRLDQKEYFTDICRLVKFAKIYGIVPHDVYDDFPQKMGETSTEQWTQFVETYNLDFGLAETVLKIEAGEYGIGNKEAEDVVTKKDVDMLKNMAFGVAAQSLRENIAEEKTIDFNDQLYMTYIFDVPFNRFDFVFIDEAQDISDVQRELLKKMLTTTGRMVAVGDSRQAIYGFRGANYESMGLIKNEFDCSEFPLSICYRCGKDIVREAKKIVPQIEYDQNAPYGVVDRQPLSMDFTFREGDLFICRYNAPITKLAMSFIKNRLPVNIIGRDYYEGIIAFIKKFQVEKNEDLMEKVRLWQQVEIKKAERRDDESKIGWINDRVECIDSFVSSVGYGETVNSTLDFILKVIPKNLDQSEKMKYCYNFSTIHRVKGLETDRVFFIDEDSIPSKYAKKDHEIEQEMNLKYVGITRAKNVLKFVKSYELKERFGC